MRKKSQLILTATGILWLLAVGIGLGKLWRYENAPSDAGTTPSVWPSACPLQPSPGRTTLIMFAHPHCPCTRASIGELALLMAKAEGRVAAYVFFIKPEPTDDGWEQTDLWYTAAEIPGVRVMRDDGSVEAHRFQAETSGQTIVYDADGRLLFSGGITESRGHSGDNVGRSAILALLSNKTAERTTSVFGCALENPLEACQQGGACDAK